LTFQLLGLAVELSLASVNHIVEVAIDFAADLPVRVIGDAGASGFCDPFKPRGNAYAVAENSIGHQ
jgi:hypothetical protein